MPPFLPPLLAFIELASIAVLVLLVALGLANVADAAHKRFMASRPDRFAAGPAPGSKRDLFEPKVDFMPRAPWEFVAVELLLLELIAVDWRAGRAAPWPTIWRRRSSSACRRSWCPVFRAADPGRPSAGGTALPIFP